MSTPSVFSYATFIARYPQFTQIPQNTAQLYWNEAQLYADNSICSVIPNTTGERDMLLNMVTAHIAQLNYPLNGQPAQALVGRISTATEGSVSVSAEMNSAPGSAAWFNQTPFGAAFWQATVKYRSMRYVPGCASRSYSWR